VISNVLPLHLVPFVVEHSPACGRTNTGQYGVNLAAGAPVTKMDLAAGVPAMETGMHVGDMHGAGRRRWRGAGWRGRAWCAGRRGRTGHAPDGGAPDEEGAQARHARGRGHGQRLESDGRWAPASGRRGRGVSCGRGRRERRRDLEASSCECVGCMRAGLWPG
jgi:hypothetical protein